MMLRYRYFGRSNNRGSRLGFARHVPKRDDRLHSIAVAVAPQGFGIVALAGQEPSAALARTAAQAGNLVRDWNAYAGLEAREALSKGVE